MTNVAPSGDGPATLPTYDPWPEDPAEFDGVAARLTDRENQSNQVRSGILGLIGDPALNQWLGQSGEAFRQTLEPVPALPAQMIYAYGTSAAAVRTYAGQIRADKSDADPVGHIAFRDEPGVRAS